jgi:Cys-tRNA(Pro) deacylase
MHPSAQKVADAALRLGLEIEIIEFDQTTRTAEDAAAAIGCQVGQIVKSLCFTVDDQPIMALLSGSNRLDERKLAGVMGVGRKRVRRAEADTVKAATGFTIGGVPPFGHTTALSVVLDEDLNQYDVVWAAAGTPFAVFAISPTDLLQASRGQAADLKAADRPGEPR